MRPNIPIDVDLQNGAPRRIRHDRRTYRVRRVLDFWVVQSRWWGLEEHRLYYRLETDRGIIEVYRATELDRAVCSTLDPRPSSLPPTTEGDTHTRELRRTDSAYRPDARQLKTSRSSIKEARRRWVLSNILD